MVSCMTSQPRPTPLDIDLATFAAQIEDHTGMSGIASTFQTYRKQSDVVAALGSKSEAKIAVRERMERFIDTGQGFVRGQAVRRVQVGGKARRVLRAAVVQSAHPELWEASRLHSSQLAVKSGLAVAPRIVVPRMNTMADVWAAHELLNAQATEAKRLAERARVKLGEMFDKVSDVWGPEVTYLTSDGWTLGRRDLRRFNEQRCREEAVSRNIDVTTMEEDTITPISIRFVIAASEEELDEIDGE